MQKFLQELLYLRLGPNKIDVYFDIFNVLISFAYYIALIGRMADVLAKTRVIYTRGGAIKEAIDIPTGLVTTMAFLILLWLIITSGGTWFLMVVLASLGVYMSWPNIGGMILSVLLLTALILWKKYGHDLTAYFSSAYKCPDEKKDETKENFYTLFTPYHREVAAAKNVNTIALSFEETAHWPARKEPLRIGGEVRQKMLVKTLGSLLLSRARILDIRFHWDHIPEALCVDLSRERLSLAAIPAPVAHRAYRGSLPKHEGQMMRHFVFLGNIQHEYLFCISSIESGIQNIYQLKGKRVGIPLRMESVWRDIRPMVFLKGDGGSQTIRAHENQLFDLLQRNEIDVFFYAGAYPSTFLEGMVNSEIRHRYQFVPCFFSNEKYFLKRNPQYRKAVIGLSHSYLPARYLPTALGRAWFSTYTENYWTLAYDVALLGTKKLDNFTGYEIARTIFSGRNNLERLNNAGPRAIRDDQSSEWFLKFHPLTPTDITRPNLPEIPVQDGAKAFYVRKGLISYCGESGCMLMLGRGRCVLCDRLVGQMELQ